MGHPAQGRGICVDKITSSGAVLIIFCCAISDFDIEQIDI